MGKWVVVGGLGVGVVGSAAIVLIGVCRIMESKGSTMVDSEDGVLGVSSVGLENCWRNCNGDRSKFVTSTGEGGLVG